jgi:hypothetical protein
MHTLYQAELGKEKKCGKSDPHNVIKPSVSQQQQDQSNSRQRLGNQKKQ